MVIQRFAVHLRCTFLVFSALLFSGPATAALVTLCGPAVCYEYDDDPLVNTGLTLFGAPALLSGSDVLQFRLTTFSVDAGGVGGAAAITTSFLFNRIWTAPGFEIMAVSAAKYGDYQIMNGGSVSATLALTAVDLVNDLGVPGFPESIVGTDIFASAMPTGPAFQNWMAIATAMPGPSFLDLASEISLQVDSSLTATTVGADDYAYIANKLALFVSVVDTPTVIPLPAAAWLFGGTLALLGFLRRAAGASRR